MPNLTQVNAKTKLLEYLFYNTSEAVSVCDCERVNFIGRDKVNCGPQYTTPSYRGPTKQAWPFFVFASAVKKERVTQGLPGLCVVLVPYVFFAVSLKYWVLLDIPKIIDYTLPTVYQDI